MSETVTPSPVSAKGGVVAPTLVMSSTAVSPAEASAACSAAAPATIVTNAGVVDLSLNTRGGPGLTLGERAGVHLVERWELEDGSGRWLFEDGSTIVLGLGQEGTKFNLWDRSLAWTVGEGDR